MRIPDAAALTAMYGTNSGEAAAMTGDDTSAASTGGGGGSGTHNDVTMNVLSSLTSTGVEVFAKDELLKGLTTPGANHGSKNPYGNVGSPSDPLGRDTQYQNPTNTYADTDYGKNENNGQLTNNSNSPWMGLGIMIGSFWVGSTAGSKEFNDGNDNSAQDATKGNSAKYAEADKASELSKVLKSLGDDLTLPDSMQGDTLFSKAGTTYDQMKDSPGEKETKKFLKEFQAAVWKQLKTTGGGWVIPTELRDYWYWIMKYVDIPGEADGTVNITNYMLPLELELQVDGVGGIQYGNAFSSEYLPSKYKDTTLFQATEINHTINDSEWSTTIKGKMRYIDLKEQKLINNKDADKSIFDKMEEKKKKADKLKNNGILS